MELKRSQLQRLITGKILCEECGKIFCEACVITCAGRLAKELGIMHLDKMYFSGFQSEGVHGPIQAPWGAN